MIRLEPLMPLWASIPLFAAMLIVAVVLLIRRPRQRVAWLRRVLMIVLLLVVALRPVTPLDTQQTERMNANVFFVVDRTGSMNAEDYAGDQPRLDGVKADMARVMGMTEGSRYSIIAFDSTATQQLPLTTDAGAATSWIDTVTTEPTAYSKGSNVDRPLQSLMSALSDAQRGRPGLPDPRLLPLRRGEHRRGGGRILQLGSGIHRRRRRARVRHRRGRPDEGAGRCHRRRVHHRARRGEGISTHRRGAAADDRGADGRPLPASGGPRGADRGDHG